MRIIEETPIYQCKLFNNNNSSDVIATFKANTKAEVLSQLADFLAAKIAVLYLSQNGLIEKRDMQLLHANSMRVDEHKDDDFLISEFIENLYTTLSECGVIWDHKVARIFV